MDCGTCRKCYLTEEEAINFHQEIQDILNGDEPTDEEVSEAIKQLFGN